MKKLKIITSTYCGHRPKKGLGLHHLPVCRLQSGTGHAIISLTFFAIPAVRSPWPVASSQCYLPNLASAACYDVPSALDGYVVFRVLALSPISDALLLTFPENLLMSRATLVDSETDDSGIAGAFVD